MRADFLLDYDVITVAHERKLYLMARLVAGSAPDNHNRRPLNLSLVIDRSGSMSGNKIDYTRQAAKLLVQNMGSDDRLSVVLYNEKVETLLPPQQVIHKDLIAQRIDKIKALGTTNLSGGWLDGLKHVRENFDGNYINRVILMTDGLANRGVTDPERLKLMGSQQYQNGISTTTMGLGDDFNEDLLVEIADASGGAFYFIESPESAPEIFSEELRGLLSVVGQNLTITVQPSQHIERVQQLNAYPTEKHGDATTFRLGDVYSEETRTLMLELSIPALHDIGAVQIATLQFAYDELNENGSQHQVIEVPVVVNVSGDALPEGAVNDEVMRSVLVLKAAEARREAVRLADERRYDEAAKVLNEAADAIYQANLNDPALDEERSALLTQSEGMNRGAHYYESYSRKSMVTQVYFTERGSHENTQALRKREMRKNAQSQSHAKEGKAPKEPEPKSGLDSAVRKTGHFEIPLPPEAVRNVENVPSPDPNQPPTAMRWGERVFNLQTDTPLIRIGRAPQNEFVMDTTGISRFHAQISRQGNELIIEDLNSTNGTHVRGQRLEKPYTLRKGDIVYLCDQRITFE